MRNQQHRQYGSLWCIAKGVPAVWN